MELICWDPNFDTGIDGIDQQHRQIVIIINQLITDAPLKGMDAMSAALQAMRDYVSEHFTFEEALMREAGYKYFQQHSTLHQRFIERLNDMVIEHERGTLSTDVLLEFLRTWLIDHIGCEDQDFAKSVKGHLPRDYTD